MHLKNHNGPELLISPLNPPFVPHSSTSHINRVSIINTITSKILKWYGDNKLLMRATLGPMNSCLAPLNLLMGLL